MMEVHNLYRTKMCQIWHRWKKTYHNAPELGRIANSKQYPTVGNNALLETADTIFFFELAARAGIRRHHLWTELEHSISVGISTHEKKV